MNNRHSLACTTHNGAQHRVYNRRVYRYTTKHHSKEESFWERRPELSHTLQALHHSCRVLSPLHLGPGFQSRYREIERYERAKRRVGNSNYDLRK